MRPEVRATMTRHRADLEELARALSDPDALLSLLDAQGIQRAALVNYVAPEVMGFTEAVNEWVSRFVRGREDRLVAIGSVNPLSTRDTAGETERLFTQLKIRMLKIHTPHQLFAANEIGRASCRERVYVLL